jgi:hypothetical protein
LFQGPFGFLTVFKTVEKPIRRLSDVILRAGSTLRAFFEPSEKVSCIALNDGRQIAERRFDVLDRAPDAGRRLAGGAQEPGEFGADVEAAFEVFVNAFVDDPAKLVVV